MKESPRQAFRWAPHTTGATIAKPKDYDEGGEFEASSAYTLWESLRLTEASLQLGDIVQLPDGNLRIFKYVGFEEAQWLAVDTKPYPIPASAPGSEAPVAL